jgi:uncharacterized protein YebE (UPF0316 family)
MQILTTRVLYAYAGGTHGKFVGILIEEKLAMGTLIIRIFLVNDETGMKERLYNAGFGVTSIDAHGMNGEVKIIYTVIKRKNLDKAVKIIEECHSKAFYSIEDVKSVKQGIFSPEEKTLFYPFRLLKKHYIKHANNISLTSGLSTPKVNF